MAYIVKEAVATLYKDTIPCQAQFAKELRLIAYLGGRPISGSTLVFPGGLPLGDPEMQAAVGVEIVVAEPSGDWPAAFDWVMGFPRERR